MKTLASIKKNETLKVFKVQGAGALRRRIMDMGITKGTSISLIKKAPLGDPIELKVRGYSLSIRLEDAKKIEVE